MCKIYEDVETLAAIIEAAENSGMKESEVDILHTKITSGRMSQTSAREIIESAERGNDISALLQ